MGGSVGTEECAGLGLLLLQSRCELRALSPTAVAFLLLVSELKGEDTGEGSSGCQPAGLSCLQGQHDENSAGSGSSVRISLVSRQLPHRNKTGAVEKPFK